MKKVRNIEYYLAGSCAIITFAVYLASLHNDFIAEWDDGEYVLNNPHIRSINPAFLRWAFFDFYAGNWHPLTWISHAIDYAIWGLNPLGHHLTSIALHAVNTFLVVMIIMRLQEVAKGTARSGQGASVRSEHGMLITAGVAGLLFGFHPVHVESVAWIAERKDLLCALFFLLGIVAYLRYLSPSPQSAPLKGGEVVTPLPWRERGGVSAKWYFLSLSFFILALMSKPMAVSLTVVLLILDWYPFRRLHSGKTALTAFIEKLPFIALSLTSSVLTILAQRAKGAIVSTEMLPLSTRLLVAAKSLLVYLWKMTVPRDFIPYYPYPKNISYASMESVFAIALVVGITLYCVMISRKQKLWLTAWSYYCVTLLPVLGVVQVGSQAMADRYVYLPSIAPFLIIGVGISWAYDKMISLRRLRFVVVMLFLSAGIVMFGGLLSLTMRQIRIWKNGFSVWNYVIEKEPGKVSIAYTNLGAVYQKLGQFDKAMENFDKALALDPGDYLAYINRGQIFDKVGQFDKAIENYNRAVKLDPNDYAAYFNRGLTFDKIGDLNKAIEDFERVIALNADEYRAHNNLGSLYSKAGLYDKAIESFSRCVAINPNYAIAYNNRGLNYSFIGQYGRAIGDFSATILLDQQFDSAYVNRANIYLRSGNRAQAEADYRKACDLGNRDGCKALEGLLSNSLY